MDGVFLVLTAAGGQMRVSWACFYPSGSILSPQLVKCTRNFQWGGRGTHQITQKPHSGSRGVVGLRT